MLDAIFGEATDIMGKALDGLSVRERVIGENIANVDTPHYKRLGVGFEVQLRQAMGDAGENTLALAVDRPGQLALGPMGVSEVTPQVVQVDGTSGRNDGNNVDVDAEMTKLAETNISYSAIASVMKERFGMLRTAIGNA